MSLLDQVRDRIKRLSEGKADPSPRPRKVPRLAQLTFRLGETYDIASDVQPVLDAAAVVDRRDREVYLPAEIWCLIVGALTFQQTLALLRRVGWRSRHPLIAAARWRYGCMANRFNTLFAQLFRAAPAGSGGAAGEPRLEIPPGYTAHPMWSLRHYRATGAAKCLRPAEMRTILSTIGQILMHLEGGEGATRAAPRGHATADGFTKVYGHKDPSFSHIALRLTTANPLRRDRGLPIPVTTRDGIVAAALQHMLVEFHKRWTAYYLAHRYPEWDPITEWSHQPPARSVVHTTRRTGGGTTTQVFHHHTNEVFGFVVRRRSFRISCLYEIRVRPDPTPAPLPGAHGPRDPPAPLERRILGVVCSPLIACSPGGHDKKAALAIVRDLQWVFRCTGRYVYPLFGELCGPSIDEGIRHG